MTRTKPIVWSCSLALVSLLAPCSIAVAPDPGLAWQESVPESGPWKNQKLLVLENEQVSVGILPGAGGRVIRYVDRSTGINHLQENSNLSSEDSGGIWDKEGVWPTTNISNHPFSYRVQQQPDRLEAVLQADLGNLAVTKKYTLAPRSSRLVLETTYKNSGTLPMRYLIAQVFQLAPGGSAGDEDYVLYPDGGGLAKKVFGSHPWEGPQAGSSPWWMVYDSQRSESLFLSYEPDPTLAERTVTWGKGVIQLQLHTRRHVSQPGESLTLRIDLHLVKSAAEFAHACDSSCFLPESDRAVLIRTLTPLLASAPVSFRDLGERLLSLPWGLLSLSVPQRVLRRPFPIDAEVRWLSSAGSNSLSKQPLKARLTLDAGRGSEIPLKESPSGKVESWHHQFPWVGLVSGSHRLRLNIDGTNDIKPLEIRFAVVDEELLQFRIERVQEAGAELARRARLSGDPTHMAVAASCEMRAEDARRKFILGQDYEEWGNSTHATDVNRLPMRLNPNTRPADVEYILRILDEVENWIDAAASGRDPFRDQKGLFQKAFYSRVDGSLQPYTVYVPKDYDGHAPHPLLLLLHGSGGDQWEIPQAAANLDGHSVFAGALEETRIESKFLLCAPLARGPSGYLYMAEVDILQMLEEVERDYRVDVDRVYVMGWSMGGSGAFLLASRFPDRFAAMMPIAGSTDSELIANASHVPCWNFHGLGDTTVSPGFLRVAEAAYQSLGLPYHDGFRERPFVWSPWSDHWVGYRMMGSFDEIEKILEPYRRNAAPKEVTLVTSELRHNKAYWVRIDALERYDEPASLKARISGTTIDITSGNVRAFSLLLTSTDIDLSHAIKVVQNGQSIFEGKAGTELRLGQQPTGPAIHKVHGLSGPLSDVYYEPFLIVTPPKDATDPGAVAARKEAEAILTKGLRGLRFYGVKIKSEQEVTVDDAEKHHLILVGVPKSSKLLQLIQSRLPVRIEGNAVIAGDHRFEGDDVGFRLIYPNPLNPRRYIVVCAGVTQDGLEGLGSIPTPNWGWSSRVTEPDVLIIDRRTRGPYKRYLAAFTFNNDWKLDARGSSLGQLDADLSLTGVECRWGDFRADALRKASGADIALVEVDDHLYPQELAAGEVTRSDLAMANNWAPIYTLEATGSQLHDAMEQMLKRWLEGTREAEWYLATSRPLAVSGFSYEFQRNLHEGERVKVNGLEFERKYRIAVTEHVLNQATDGEAGSGYLGWLPTVHRENLNEIEAQSLYLSKTGRLQSPADGRIIERK